MDRDATSFASPSHGNTNSYVYDVFLNHRGPDVKKTLASHIYHRLRAHGIRVFLDLEEFREGEYIPKQIEGAIRTASVHVAIFSPKYAESSWCLKELLLMLESRTTIIPVFYNVKPSDLRWARGGDGVYARSLGVLEKKRTHDSQPRYESNTIGKWRDALSAVADISGFELEACNGDEGELIDKVVQQVLKKVPKPPLHVAKYPTGLHEKIKDVERTLSWQRQSGKPSIVGIVGLGGVGKTTLAKEIFNRERSNYDRSCFLSDIRSRSLHSLQNIFLKNLTSSKVQIDSVDEGIVELKRSLSSSSHPVLIVLDDVDNINQLDALCSPVKDTIHGGSLILVTSRNKNVLRSSGIIESSIYMLKGLNPQHSRELFCSHAFGQPHPAVGFEEVVKRFLDACNGLPLSLKVLGALLRGNDDLGYWNEQLLKTSKILPSDIQSTLKISFDALDKEEKQIFLDIACFFIQQDRDRTIRIWNGSGWAGRLGLQMLEDRCLVELDSKNRLQMHDHIRDLGRDMAKNSEYPRRLWRLTDNLHNVSDQSPVRGISTLHGNGPDQSFENIACRSSLSRLELLLAEGSFVERVLSVGDLPQLIYLRWGKCPITTLSFSIPIRSLSVLHIEGRNLKTLWQHESQAPVQLRELHIDAPLSDVPKSIGKLKHLEKIVLYNSYLETLPNEFCDMHSLKHIGLNSCKNLTLLPDSFGNLTSLQSLDLSSCSTLQALPDSVENLRGLQSLDLSGCSTLQVLPDSLGYLTGLQSLDLSGCSTLQVLPDSVGKLMGLKRLNLHKCSNLQALPDSVGNLTGLQSLLLGDCSTLQALPDSVGNLTNLQSLDLSKCSNLEMLPYSLGNLTNLQSLDLSKCSNLEMLPYSLGNLRNLQHINLSKCSNLRMLPNFLDNLKHLQHMDLSGCSNLQILPNSLGNLKNLQHIDLSRCLNLQMLPNSFGNLTNLQHIELSGCSNLPILPNSFGNLIQLKHLCLRKCYDLTISSETLGQIRTLEWLEISGCYGIDVLPPQITHQRFLREMYLFCPFLKELPSAIGDLSHLEVLHLTSSCLELLEIGTLVSLEKLQTRDCVTLKSIQGLAQLTKLRTLDVTNCPVLEELPGVEHLRSLKECGASGCPKQVQEQLETALSISRLYAT